MVIAVRAITMDAGIPMKHVRVEFKLASHAFVPIVLGAVTAVRRFPKERVLHGRATTSKHPAWKGAATLAAVVVMSHAEGYFCSPNPSRPC